MSSIEGLDLVTEGVLTMGRSLKLLKQYENDEFDVEFFDSHAWLSMAAKREADRVSFVHFRVYSDIFSQVQPCRSRISPAPA